MDPDAIDAMHRLSETLEEFMEFVRAIAKAIPRRGDLY